MSFTIVHSLGIAARRYTSGMARYLCTLAARTMFDVTPANSPVGTRNQNGSQARQNSEVKPRDGSAAATETWT
jgi:hypothetical protein